MTADLRYVRLGVNIDHVATLRQARGTLYPDPLLAALMAEQAGADGITLHPREDGRHIQREDVRRLRGQLQTPMNLEMAVTEDMLNLAEELCPAWVCLVPEKREELTTEGGLDVMANDARVRTACERLQAAGIRVSLFVDPDSGQIRASHDCGADAVEIHTGRYAEAVGVELEARELAMVSAAISEAVSLGMIANAGHGLHYHNVLPVASISGLHELNIGHAIIARAVFVGLTAAVREMRALLDRAVILSRASPRS